METDSQIPVPTLTQVRVDLVTSLYALAQSLDLYVRPGTGAAALGVKNDTYLGVWPELEDYELGNVGLAGALEAVYRYAFYGELVTPWLSDDSENGDLGRLRVLREMTSASVYVAEARDEVVCAYETPVCEGAFNTMLDLAFARYRLDYEQYLSLGDIALLGKLNERSVRNALHAEGSAMLHATRDGAGELQVTKTEALRWLLLRQSFNQTTRIGGLRGEVTDGLTAFMLNRMGDLCYGSSTEHSEEELAALRIGHIAHNHSLSAEDLDRMIRQPSNLSESDWRTLSQILSIDAGWLAREIAKVSLPERTQFFIERAEKLEAIPTALMDEKQSTLEAVLTDAGIRNGYFNIERRYAERYFPIDCFGSRGGEAPGATINLHHTGKGSPYITDLRIKSEALVSPRKRFSAYFTAHAAKEGDVIRFKKLGDRDFELIFVSK
jgi:hypothetical protein